MRKKLKFGKIIIYDIDKLVLHFVRVKSNNDLSFQLCLSIENKEISILFNAFEYTFKYKKKCYYFYFLNISTMIKSINKKLKNNLKKFL